MNENLKWVAMWGNAVSISENRPESYAKDITLRYPVFCPFAGNKIRITFDNYCGLEAVSIARATVMVEGVFSQVSFGGSENVTIGAGQKSTSDEIDVCVKSGQTMYVSFYLEDYTQMRSSVYVQGPLSGGMYSLGDATREVEFDINRSRKTNIYYFLSNISILTGVENQAIVCYGDSITAQDWPDYLQLELRENGLNQYSVIRRATSGSRILREYSCITYESYGLKGTNRFEHEVPTDGATHVIIQQGINDIIHPVGVEVNPFRPMSDMPGLEELEAGMEWYIAKAKSYGYKVILGTLLPIEGWRTYAPFRDEFRNAFNEYMRNNHGVDGVIDFDKAVRDVRAPKAFGKSYDSGDHLHPSGKGYERMAQEALGFFLPGNIKKKRSASSMTRKERARLVIEKLKSEYPDSGCSLVYEEPWKLLISVRLAAQCTDERVNKIVPKLYEKYPTIEAIANAPLSDIEDIVNPCGLGRSKARDIKACMQMLHEVYKDIVPDSMEELLKLPGVGRKSANLIIGDVYGKPAIVTDTHCIRLSNRIGLVTDEKDPAKVEKALWKIVPPEEGNALCHRLVDHGRLICTARTAPYCDRCCLRDVCKSAK